MMNARALAGGIFVLTGLIVLTGAARVDAATFVVNSTADEVDLTPGDGVCLTASAACTLRAAVIEANALPGSDRITLPAGTYTLTLAGLEGPKAVVPFLGDLDITESVTITGAGPSATIVEAGTTLAMAVGRVFDLTVRADPGPAQGIVNISGVTIRHGDSSSMGSVFDCGGGGIVNRRNLLNEAGILNLTDSVVTNNRAHNGGGLCNMSPGSATLLRTSVTDNVAFAAFDDSWGGGIKNMSGGSLFINGLKYHAGDTLTAPKGTRLIFEAREPATYFCTYHA